MIKKCEDCNKIVPKDYEYCPTCGRKVKKTLSEEETGCLLLIIFAIIAVFGPYFSLLIFIFAAMIGILIWNSKKKR